MIRFIDLGKQTAVDASDPKYLRQFAFYDTVYGMFLKANGEQAFDFWEDFEANATGELSLDLVEGCKKLCPKWVFQNRRSDYASNRH